MCHSTINNSQVHARYRYCGQPAFNVDVDDAKDWDVEALHRAIEGLNCKIAVDICHGNGIEANIDWKTLPGPEWQRHEAIFPVLVASFIGEEDKWNEFSPRYRTDEALHWWLGKESTLSRGDRDDSSCSVAGLRMSQPNLHDITGEKEPEK